MRLGKIALHYLRGAIISRDFLFTITNLLYLALR